MKDDTIGRQAAIDEFYMATCDVDKVEWAETVLKRVPSAQTEIIPHRNYKYLSDYWCECGWHLGKKGEVKYCADCGKRVKWDG